MTDDFDPNRYHDTYQEQLRELIEAKLQGGEAFTADEQPTALDEPEDVADLLSKLEASVRSRAKDNKSTMSKPPAKKPAGK